MYIGMIHFTETLREGAPCVSKQAASPALRKPSARILLIEDEPDLSDSISRVLRGAGHRVVAVQDGLEAFFHLEKGAPDLIISDIGLPGFDGLEILQRVRANAQLAFTPVIFLTAAAGLCHQRTAMNLGADDFLAKPVDRAELLQAVESRLRRSGDYREQCETRLRRQKDFVSLVAHDLRAPLTALGLGLDLAALQLGSADAVVHRTVETAVQSMNRLIDRLVLMAHHQGDAIPFEPRKVDLAVLCERAAELSQGHRSSRHILEIRAPAGDAAAAWLDPVLVEQILCNLLSNAFKYSPDGGTVTLTAQPDDHCLRFEVADQGTGMTAEEAKQVFDLAFRAERHREISGNGVGLFGVKLLAERHGGRIECRSRLGVGTRFVVVLPSEPSFLPASA